MVVADYHDEKQWNSFLEPIISEKTSTYAFPAIYKNNQWYEKIANTNTSVEYTRQSCGRRVERVVRANAPLNVNCYTVELVPSIRRRISMR